MPTFASPLRGRRRSPRWRRIQARPGPFAERTGQRFTALGINSATSLIAGAILGSITGTFERYPGLLIMMPAAIGLRGNVFSTLGSRISTSIHIGDYAPSLRRGSVVGDNVVAAVALSGLLALLLAVVARSLAAVSSLAETPSVLDLATISILGGLLASAVVLGATLVLVSLATRRDWDLDGLVAPVVSTLGDVITVPALWLATHAVGHGQVSTTTGWALVVLTLAGAGVTWWSRQERLRRIVRESTPVLVVAAVLSTLAGLVLEHQLDTFARYPALLVLVPAFISGAGALGGMLVSSLATGLHLGTIPRAAVPSRGVWTEVRGLATLAVPLFAVTAAGAHVVALWLGEASPGVGSMVGVAIVGGVGAVMFAFAVAYYGALGAVRVGVDPDTYGIPTVTSAVDFVGAAALLGAVGVLGVV